MNRVIRIGYDKAPIEASQIALGNSHPYTIEAINNGVNALIGEVRYDEALRLAKCALQIVEGKHGKNTRNTQLQREKIVVIESIAAWHPMFVRWSSINLGMYHLKRTWVPLSTSNLRPSNPSLYISR
jgi:hypothetical protein